MEIVRWRIGWVLQFVDRRCTN